MALTLTIDIGTACAGGEHYPITAIPSQGPSRTYNYTMEQLDAPITAEQEELFIRILLKQYRRQLNGATRAQQKAAIEAKVLDLTVTVP
jgi:hypothetical protein